MKPIPITTNNAGKIEAALRAVNSGASRHTYTSFDEIATEAARAERKVLALLTKTQAVGAKFMSTSGGSVPNSYKYARISTSVVLERRRAGWVLTGAERSTLWATAPKSTLVLTTEQDAAAVARLRAGYAVR